MNNLLDLKALSRSKDLPFIARTLAQGFLHGSHGSIQRGVGIEFSQYRAYEPGDDLAKVDWKLFARTDKYFVREAERESDTCLWFALDSSASMSHRNQANKNNSNNITKLQFAKVVAATIGYIAQLQGDSLGCIALSAEKPTFLPAHGGYKHWQKLLLTLNAIKPCDNFPDYQQVYTQLQTMRRSGIVFVFSDFYQANDEIYQLINQLVDKRTEVIAVQLESSDEINFDFDDVIRFEDLESQQAYLLSPKLAKNSYLANRAAFNQELNSYLSSKGVTHWRVDIDQPIDETLYQYLAARQRVLSV
ncbi:DUF58 domain-containing protein [Thalassotalea piscium]|uniref:Uncharacterized protein (DUF58 family) n=1 Tax=Thalassotalea piscium TaxID=1230533 RepID=A0A7X0NGS9_9GAMM|nr:DUF58 domain-containing protein [Thalassotalea piscium]MBB6543187.1 uncharacterized protein (DUF58 family) [Thalassotalea piscium]